MSKVILEFDSVEESDEIQDAINGWRWKNALWDLDQKLRNTTKYGTSIIQDKIAFHLKNMLLQIVIGNLSEKYYKTINYTLINETS